MLKICSKIHSSRCEPSRTFWSKEYSSWK